jgi:hypothetical protein
MESVETLADHIESLYGSKVIAHSSHQDYLEIRLEKETEVSGEVLPVASSANVRVTSSVSPQNGAVFIYTSPPVSLSSLTGQQR